jgi:hypothetical protein
MYHVGLHVLYIHMSYQRTFINEYIPQLLPKKAYFSNFANFAQFASPFEHWL